MCAGNHTVIGSFNTQNSLKLTILRKQEVNIRQCVYKQSIIPRIRKFILNKTLLFVIVSTRVDRDAKKIKNKLLENVRILETKNADSV